MGSRHAHSAAVPVSVCLLEEVERSRGRHQVQIQVLYERCSSQHNYIRGIYGKQYLCHATEFCALQMKTQ